MLIKYATVVLLPVYIYAMYRVIRKKKLDDQIVYKASFILMTIMLFLSPLREELYSWYFIWPFTFLVLIEKWNYVKICMTALSFGLLLRIAPYLFTLNWGATTPFIKMLVTFIPITIAIISYPLYKKKI